MGKRGRTNGKENKAGQPRKFKGDGSELVDLFKRFCDEIEDEGFEDVPSQSSFCRWLERNYESTDRKTIYNTLNRYFPNLKKSFQTLQSDILAKGGILGKYQPTMTIFTLKNWTHWADKVEATIDDSDRQKEAQDNLVSAIKESLK
jgi:hypothetical protein